MLKRILSPGFVLAALLVLPLGIASSVRAQEITSIQETLALRPGSIFEIYAESTPSAAVNWVLSKGRTFEQAKRSVLFSMRPTEIAEYFLNGEVVEKEEGSVRTIFRIQTSNDAPLITQSTKETPQIVKTSPALNAEGSIQLEGGERLIRLDIIHADIEQHAMDINIAEDLNGDGDTYNDNILANSIFAQGRGSLHIWLKPTLEKQTMLIAARLKNGALITQQIDVVSQLYVQKALREAQEQRAKTGLTVEPRGDGTYAFAVRTGSGLIAVPALYYWNFGDGTQSLLDEPTHTFPTEQTYNVQVRITDARSGAKLLELEKEVSVKNSDKAPTTDAGKNDGKQKPEGDTKAGGSLMKTILKALVVLAVSLGIGMLVVFVVSKLKGMNLQKSLEAAEKKLVGDSPESTTALPLMELKKEDKEEDKADTKNEDADTDLDANEEKKEETAENTKPADDSEQASPAPETPEVNRQVPSWLAPSPSTAETAPKETPAPPQEPLKPVASAGPTETPTQSEPTSVPSWLQGSSTTTPAAPTTEKKETTTGAQKEMPSWLAPSSSVQKSQTAESAQEPVAPEAPNETSAPEKKETIATPKESTSAEKKQEPPLPAWLAGTSQKTEQTPPPPPPPPAPAVKETAPSEKIPPAVTEPTKQEAPVKTTPPKDDAALPPWLAGSTEKTADKPAPAASLAGTTSEVSKAPQKPAEKAEEPATVVGPASSARVPVEKQKESTPAPVTSKAPVQVNGDKTREEREQERKRRKRQRYRENKRKREQEEKANGQNSAPAAAPAPAPKEQTSVAAESKPVPQEKTPSAPAAKKPEAPPPEWLKGTPIPPQETPSNAAAKQEGDDDVQFLISADSLDQQKLQDSGEIPLQEKDGE